MFLKNWSYVPMLAQTYHVPKNDLFNPPASTSRVLGSQMCTITPYYAMLRVEPCAWCTAGKDSAPYHQPHLSSGTLYFMKTLLTPPAVSIPGACSVWFLYLSGLWSYCTVITSVSLKSDSGLQELPFTCTITLAFPDPPYLRIIS